MSAHAAPPLQDLVRLRQCQVSKADAGKQSVLVSLALGTCLITWLNPTSSLAK